MEGYALAGAKAPAGREEDLKRLVTLGVDGRKTDN